MLLPARDVTLWRWYFTEALPKLDGPSIQGGIEAKLATYGRHGCKQYAHAHGYSIDPNGDETVDMTAEDARLYGKREYGAHSEVAWGSPKSARSFRLVSGAIELVGARDRLSREAIAEFATYGDAWGGIASPARAGAVYWMTEPGAEVIKLIDADGWSEMGHPRLKMAQRGRKHIERRRVALQNAAERMLVRAWEAWTRAAGEVRKGRAA